jgi:hypothetical protein
MVELAFVSKVSEVKTMLLIYLLIALTFSTVLTASFSAHIPERRKGEAFIGFFAVLMALAWVADEWLIPSLRTGLKTPWPSAIVLAMFCTLLVLSAAFSIRAPGRPLRQTVSGFENRLSTEAAVFDLFLWSALVLAGISLLKAAGT